MRRLLTFLSVALATAVGALWWLHEGDLAEAVQPVVANWNADVLARDAGIVDPVEEEAEQPQEGAQDEDGVREEPSEAPSE